MYYTCLAFIKESFMFSASSFSISSDWCGLLYVVSVVRHRKKTIFFWCPKCFACDLIYFLKTEVKYYRQNMFKKKKIVCFV